MMPDEYLVECKIDDYEDNYDGDEDDEEMKDMYACTTGQPQFSLIQAGNRDPFGVNSHLKVEFSDVLAEPASTHSSERVWVYSGVGFEAARLWSYRCLTTLCALPLSCLSGCVFAFLACLHVWFMRPCVQVCHTCLPCVRSLWMSVVNIFIVPLCTSVSRCCGGVYVLHSQD
ncbi:caveolin-2 [Brachyhypopomus gauderio]|uniref:caveolin-2 n=1 Tax=Brachyhypopomus gauderio TaxID=698409 RepID=UPI00404174FB